MSALVPPPGVLPPRAGLPPAVVPLPAGLPPAVVPPPAGLPPLAGGAPLPGGVLPDDPADRGAVSFHTHKATQTCCCLSFQAGCYSADWEQQTLLEMDVYRNLGEVRGKGREGGGAPALLSEGGDDDMALP